MLVLIVTVQSCEPFFHTWSFNFFRFDTHVRLVFVFLSVQAHPSHCRCSTLPSLLHSITRDTSSGATPSPRRSATSERAQRTPTVGPLIFGFCSNPVAYVKHMLFISDLATHVIGPVEQLGRPERATTIPLSQVRNCGQHVFEDR